MTTQNYKLFVKKLIFYFEFVIIAINQSNIWIIVLARWYLFICDGFNSCCSLETEAIIVFALCRIKQRLLPSIVWRYSTKILKSSCDI